MIKNLSFYHFIDVLRIICFLNATTGKGKNSVEEKDEAKEK